MITRTTLIGLLLAVGAGVGAYTATVTTRPADPPATQAAADPATEALMNWLNVTDPQRAAVAREDAGFAEELKRLRADLQAKRDALAAAMEKPRAADSEIMARVEEVIAASNALERRVASYLLAVRQHLTSEQQRRLFGLCAEGVRQGHGRRWRGGAGPEISATRPGRGPWPSGDRPGRGPGPHGPGRGRGER